MFSGYDFRKSIHVKNNVIPLPFIALSAYNTDGSLKTETIIDTVTWEAAIIEYTYDIDGREIKKEVTKTVFRSCSELLDCSEELKC